MDGLVTADRLWDAAFGVQARASITSTPCSHFLTSGGTVPLQDTLSTSIVLITDRVTQFGLIIYYGGLFAPGK